MSTDQLPSVKWVRALARRIGESDHLQVDEYTSGADWASLLVTRREDERRFFVEAVLTANSIRVRVAEGSPSQIQRKQSMDIPEHEWAVASFEFYDERRIQSSIRVSTLLILFEC